MGKSYWLRCLQMSVLQNDCVDVFTCRVQGGFPASPTTLSIKLDEFVSKLHADGGCNLVVSAFCDVQVSADFRTRFA